MFGLLVRRCLGAVPLVFLLSVFSFLLIKAVPGDPVDVLLGASEKEMSPAQVTRLRHEMGLDEPLVKQYAHWVSGWWGEGELGRSYRDGRPVLEVIGERIPATLLLAGSAIVLAFTAGIFWGLAMAFFAGGGAGRLFDRLLSFLALFLYSAPNFWLAVLAVFAVARWLPGWPIVGMHPPAQPLSLLGLMAHLALPAVMLSTRRAAKVALFVRTSVLEEMGKEYVLYARSKGLSRAGTVLRHALRNSLAPVITLLGLALPALLGGSVLIETVFSWPGLGRLAVDATFGRNYPVLLALVVVYGVMVIAANLIADILYAAADPRVRQSLEAPAAAAPAAGGAAR